METGGFHNDKRRPLRQGVRYGAGQANVPIGTAQWVFHLSAGSSRSYWNILTEIARINACSVSALLSYVDWEVHLRYGGVKNFSGLVRVVCVVHLLKGRVASPNPE